MKALVESMGSVSVQINWTRFLPVMISHTLSAIINSWGWKTKKNQWN
jgi:hypothetical protein